MCLAGANYAIKFCKCFRKKILLFVYRYQKMLNMKKAGKTFTCPWLFIYLLFQKRTVPLGENSSKGNYLIDGKHSMGNFDSPGLHRFS